MARVSTTTVNVSSGHLKFIHYPTLGIFVSIFVFILGGPRDPSLQLWVQVAKFTGQTYLAI